MLVVWSGLAMEWLQMQKKVLLLQQQEAGLLRLLQVLLRASWQCVSRPSGAGCSSSRRWKHLMRKLMWYRRVLRRAAQQQMQCLCSVVLRLLQQRQLSRWHRWLLLQQMLLLLLLMRWQLLWLAAAVQMQQQAWVGQLQLQQHSQPIVIKGTLILCY
jgi:hypothetical protein